MHAMATDGWVSVVFTKWGDRPHWRFRCLRLGDDAFGTWLAGPPGTVTQRGDEPPVIPPHGFVGLVPRTGDWMAFFDGGGPHEIYVDVSTTPLWRGDLVTCVDLDLDVIRRRGGGVELLDEDEFLDHQVRLGYPPAIIEGARATADWLMEAVARRREPFDTAGAARLAAQGWDQGSGLRPPPSQGGGLRGARSVGQ